MEPPLLLHLGQKVLGCVAPDVFSGRVHLQVVKEGYNRRVPDDMVVSGEDQRLPHQSNDQDN